MDHLLSKETGLSNELPMVNSSRRAALRGWRRPGDTGRAGLAPHASQNTKYKNPKVRAQTEIAAGLRIPCPFPLTRGENDKGIAARTKDGGIAQLLERPEQRTGA